MDLELTGKTALVTGSFRGTGMIIADMLLKEGVKTIVHGLKPNQAEEAVKELGAGVPFNADITTENGCGSLIEFAREFPVNILVNNYGTAEPSSWDDEDSSAWFKAFEKNVLSAERITKGLLPIMKKNQWGRVINLGTTGSTRPNPQNPAYYSSKGALATMTVSLAGALAKTGITANVVSPGLILTPEVKKGYEDREKRKGGSRSWESIENEIAENIPIGRIVRREEVAALVAFLCSPASDAITGQNIRIDGGALGIVS